MATTSGGHTFRPTSQPAYSPNNPLEWERLDEMHKGFDVYLGHKLSLGPPVEDVNKILEIGCGSGAWAIQAAQTYPGATVTAVDISPMPPRPLPPNLQFLQLDVTESLPFETESFDIIHARLVLVHIKDWKQVLENVVSLLKPRGWLWIEDADSQFYGSGPQDLGPALRVSNDLCLSYSKSSHFDPFVASSLGSVLKNLGSFSEVNDIEIICHTNCRDDDLRNRYMCQVFYTSARRFLASPNSRWTAAGITSELKEEIFREAEDPSRSVYFKFHMTYSQKE